MLKYKQLLERLEKNLPKNFEKILTVHHNEDRFVNSFLLWLQLPNKNWVEAKVLGLRLQPKFLFQRKVYTEEQFYDLFTEASYVRYF